MNYKLNYIYIELPTRKYKRTNKITGKSEIVTVTNRNNLSIEKHLELLNLNDPYNLYSEKINLTIKNKTSQDVFLFTQIKITSTLQSNRE